MIVNRIYPSYFCGLPIVKGTYERQRAATLGGNESQERVCICFTNGPEHGEGKTRGNKCQRDFMARSNDFSLPRTTPRNNELRFASPFGKQRPAHRLLPHRQFLFDSSLVFSGGGEKRGEKTSTTGADIDDLLSSVPSDTSGKYILSMFYFIFICIIEFFINVPFIIRSVLCREYIYLFNVLFRGTK